MLSEDTKRRIAMLERNIESSKNDCNNGNITYEQYTNLEKDANKRIKELKRGKN